jgi:hypothetical protein
MSLVGVLDRAGMFGSVLSQPSHSSSPTRGPPQMPAAGTLSPIFMRTSTIICLVLELVLEPAVAAPLSRQCDGRSLLPFPHGGLASRPTGGCTLAGSLTSGSGRVSPRTRAATVLCCGTAGTSMCTLGRARPGRATALRTPGSDVSDCHLRKTATEYDRKPGMKWLRCTAK